MGYVMYDVDDNGKEINQIHIKNRPEKIYDWGVDNYGDKRDFYRKVKNKPFISMPKIGQFRHVVKEVSDDARFIGVGAGGQSIYKDVELPILTFKGTTKLHGTCSSVCYDGNEIWVQSKNRIITPNDDNAGFAQFVADNKEYFQNLMESLYIGVPIAVFGEWAGGGIASPAAIAKVPRAFFIFGVKIKDVGWINIDIALKVHKNVFKLTDFRQYSIDIDFNNPISVQNRLVEMVEEVERECPVAKEFGVSGIGEGIVFTAFYNNKHYQFKVKGEKHVNTCKVKKLDRVDDVKLQLIQDVAEKVTPEWRLEQMWNETFDIINGGIPTEQKTGDFLKALFQDIIEEESDILQEACLKMKDVNKTVAKIAKTWFFTKLNTI